MKKIFSVILGIFIAVIIFNSGCKKDETTPAAKPGNLEVFVTDAAQINYFGGAEVFLYATDADRTNDPQRTNYKLKAKTDYSDPENIGASFYNLTVKKYFVFARWDMGGGNFYVGTGEATVVSDTTVHLKVNIQ